MPSFLAIFLTSRLLPSPINTGHPLANSTASSMDTALTMIKPPIVSLMSPKGPLVTTFLEFVVFTTRASSNGNPVPLTNLFCAEMPPIQSMVCFIQVWICSGEATFIPSSCLMINANSSIVFDFNCYKCLNTSITNEILGIGQVCYDFFWSRFNLPMYGQILSEFLENLQCGSPIEFQMFEYGCCGKIANCQNKRCMDIGG